MIIIIIIVDTSTNNIISLWIQPPLIAPCYWNVLQERMCIILAPKIHTSNACQLCPESGPELWLIDVVFALFKLLYMSNTLKTEDYWH